MKYIAIELEKINKKQQLLSLVICNIIITALVIMMKFLIPDQISSPDTGLPAIQLDTTVIIDILIKAVFIVWQAVLIASLIVGEFENRTALILYTYPVRMARIIISKILVVFLLTFTFMLVSEVFQNIVMFGLNKMVPMITYSINISEVSGIFITSISSIFMGMIAFAVGILNRSSIATIVTSILIMCIVTSAVGGPGGIISKISVAVVLGLLGLTAGLYTLWKIETEDY